MLVGWRNWNISTWLWIILSELKTWKVCLWFIGFGMQLWQDIMQSQSALCSAFCRIKNICIRHTCMFSLWHNSYDYLMFCRHIQTVCDFFVQIICLFVYLFIMHRVQPHTHTIYICRLLCFNLQNACHTRL